jgi:hypothetical protein
MLRQYDTPTVFDKKNGIKEVVQEIVLCGLSRAGFFKTAVFYGGTALRVFHGLDRFSEDLDFSLRAPDHQFSIDGYLPTLEREIRSYGLGFKVEIKDKSSDSAIKSAFLKGNTKEHMLMFYPNDQLALTIGPNELIKVKMELDTSPPDYASFEIKYKLLPIPYEIALYDMPSLFAGKIHAVICRAWKSRVKGRDLYDYVFYRSKGTAVNLKHLAARLAQSGIISFGEEITIGDVKDMLCKRFANIDYAQAKLDIQPFIKNQAALDVWRTDFFCDISENLEAGT